MNERNAIWPLAAHLGRRWIEPKHDPTSWLAVLVIPPSNAVASQHKKASLPRKSFGQQSDGAADTDPTLCDPSTLDEHRRGRRVRVHDLVNDPHPDAPRGDPCDVVSLLPESPTALQAGRELASPSTTNFALVKMEAMVGARTFWAAIRQRLGRWRS